MKYNINQVKNRRLNVVQLEEYIKELYKSNEELRKICKRVMNTNFELRIKNIKNEKELGDFIDKIIDKDESEYEEYWDCYDDNTGSPFLTPIKLRRKKNKEN